MMDKVWCYKLRVIPKRVLEPHLREERCHNFLAVDTVSPAVEVPVSEAVPMKVLVGHFIPEAGFYEEELQGYFWKELWVDAKEWEEKLCPILAYSDGTVEDTAERSREK